MAARFQTGFRRMDGYARTVWLPRKFRQVEQQVLFWTGLELWGEVKRDLLADGKPAEGVVVLLIDMGAERQVLGGSGGVAEDVLLEESDDFRAAAGPIRSGDRPATKGSERVEQSVRRDPGFVRVVAGRKRLGAERNRRERRRGEKEAAQIHSKALSHCGSGGEQTVGRPTGQTHIRDRQIRR